MSLALTKWFRRNNRKVLAIVVIVLMVGFIGGSALRMGCKATGFDPGQVVATYGIKGKITQTDLLNADRELDILRKLGAPSMLRSRDISGVLLGEILFADRNMSSRVMGALRNAIQQGQLRVTNQQLLDLYKRDYPENIYWIVLKKEVEQVGLVIDKQVCVALLSQKIPQLYEGLTYSQVMNELITSGIPEEVAIDAFSKLLEVHEYARQTVSGEDFTLAQVSQLASRQNETAEVEFVRIPADLFTDDQPEPSDRQIKDHFEKYKTYYPSQVTDENPYGFGYKFNDMVKLEYLMVKQEDIEKLIEEPTLEDKEKYFQNNRVRFTKQVPMDPNDPNSPSTDKLMKFGEAAAQITNMIKAQRIREKTDAIIGKVKYLAEKSYGDIAPAELTDEKLKELAPGYEKIAEEISGTFPIEIYQGQTGLLNFTDIQQDEYLSRMFYRPQTSEQISYPVVQYVFAVEQLGSSGSVLISGNNPKLYETFGPVSDSLGQLAGVIRVIDAQQARVPESINESIDKTTIKLDEKNSDNDDLFIVKDKVIEELKLSSAQGQAGKIAEQFIALAQDTGWEQAIEEYNELYPAEPNEPNNFDLIDLPGLQKIGSEAVEILRAQSEGFAGAALSEYQTKARILITDKLFSLVDPKSDTPKKLPVVVEMKPNMSYYCIKSLKINRLDIDKYYKEKARSVYQYGFREFQNLAFDHFKPENIIKRMNFKVVQEKSSTQEPNEPSGDSDTEQG